MPLNLDLSEEDFGKFADGIHKDVLDDYISVKICLGQLQSFLVPRQARLQRLS